MSPIPLRQWLLLVTLLQTAAAPDGKADPDLAKGKAAARQFWQHYQQSTAPADLVAALCESDYPDGLRRQLDASQRWCEQTDCHLLTRLCPSYPPLLATIPDPPPVLFVRGDVRALARPQLAIVGTRKPSSAGKRLAGRFAAQVCEAGYAVTSGFALGIDAAAHEGALRANGSTIAVLGTGIDRLYPAGHKALAAAVCAQGALVSELLPGSEPLAWHFPRRNRIISGLAHGVLVVEAALRSGSLITARMAAEQGREIFAVPGPVEHALSRGCHRLLREGAVLVEGVEDILAELGGLLQWEQARCSTAADPAAAAIAGLDPLASRLLELVGCQPTAVDQLARDSGLDIAELLPRLVQLELAGLLECRAGSYQRCVAPPAG